MPALSGSAPAAPTQASATWVDGERFLTTGSSGHAIIFDSDRGLNSAPGPMEMVLRALCACSATDVVMILAKARQRFTSVVVEAEGERAPKPPTVYTRIHVRYRVAGHDLDTAAVERAVALSHEKYCSVLATLQHTATITHELAVGPA